jgi:hypothetical protein
VYPATGSPSRGRSTGSHAGSSAPPGGRAPTRRRRRCPLRCQLPSSARVLSPPPSALVACGSVSFWAVVSQRARPRDARGGGPWGGTRADAVRASAAPRSGRARRTPGSAPGACPRGRAVLIPQRVSSRSAVSDPAILRAAPAGPSACPGAGRGPAGECGLGSARP